MSANRVRHHQLFFAGMDQRRARPAAMPRRRGVKGWPRKLPPAVAIRPRPAGGPARAVRCPPPCLPLRPDRPANRAGSGQPVAAWALHLAHTMAETRGLDAEVQRN